MKHSRRRIAFYSNSTFDLLARCGDVYPMPGLQATTSYHHSKLSLMLLNARSLVNKLVDFQASIYANSVDIVIITETWLTSAILDHEILPSYYDVYRRDRGEDKRGGGVLIAIKNGVASARRTDLETNCELVVVEVNPSRGNKFLVGGFYSMRGKALKRAEAQHDLGVLITCDARFNEHIYAQVNKANKMLGFIHRSLSSRSDQFLPTFRSLYVALVRLHLEYASEIWSPKSVTLIKLIEGV